MITYLDSVCMGSKLTLIVAICIMTVMATVEYLKSGGPGADVRRRAWAIALGICVALTVLFPNNGAQYHQLESTAISGWQLCTSMAAGDIMAFILGGTVYLVVAWVLPAMLPIELKHKLLIMLAVNGLCLFLLAFGTALQNYEKQQKLDAQQALVAQISAAVAAYVQQQQPGIECTIGGPDGNAIRIGPRQKHKGDPQ